MNETHESIITGLMAEARIMLAQEDTRKRSERAKRAWIARREREGGA